MRLNKTDREEFRRVKIVILQMEKSEIGNPPNVPQTSPIENFWVCLVQRFTKEAKKQQLIH